MTLKRPRVQNETNITDDLAYLYERDEHSLISPDIRLIHNINDLPAVDTDGVITLRDNTSYEIIGEVDLQGNRIVLGTNNTIFGSNASSSLLKSTGLVGTALITGTTNFNVYQISLQADIILDLNASGVSNKQRLFWNNIKFIDSTIGTISNYDTVSFNEIVFNNCDGLTFSGVNVSINLTNMIFDVSTGNTAIILDSSLEAQHFRLVFTRINLNTGTGIDADVGLTAPIEGYVLQSVNFVGNGTPLKGIMQSDDRSRFRDCRGIENTGSQAQYFMLANSETTNIPSANTFVKIEGSTNPGSFIQRFTLTDNRATYDGALDGFYRVNATVSATSLLNQQIRIRIAKNGVTIAESESIQNTGGIGSVANVLSQTIVKLEGGVSDFIEVWIANGSGSGNITVSNMNATVDRIN